MIRPIRGLSLKYGLGSVAFAIALLWCFSTSGCANSCFVAVLNPGGTVIAGTASNLPLACPPPIKKTSVKILAKLTVLCRACSAANPIQGFFLSLAGIELHTKTSTLGDSSGWVELFPDLEKRPRQVDLMSGDTDANASGLLGESAAIPAVIYDQVRLRLVPSPSDPESLPSTGNACGASGFNCMIMANGQVYVLLLDNDAQELRIASEALAGGFLFFSLGGNEELQIQATPVWSMVSSFPAGLRFLPVLKGSARIERAAAAME